ncbi:MAG: ABC transporter permease [Ancrocorticia sp.]|uniref:ABC transporter permease n=1 Tax=Ancrocorticia sp. TaxID=2593684 RepID=UPI003F8FE594
MTAQAPATNTTRNGTGRIRMLVQPVICVAIIAGCFIYTSTADLSTTEARTLDLGNIWPLVRQHLWISLIATIATVIIAIPIGIGLTRGPMLRYSKPIITIAGFGQAAPAIGLIALGAAIFGIGTTGAVVALVVYGLLPIIANTVAGIGAVDPKVVEASRGMGMSSFATLLKVELPLALPIIIAGVRTALVLIVGTVALASFTGGGGLGELVTSGIKLRQDVVLIVGALLIAALALLIDWLAHLVELTTVRKGGTR